MLIILLPAPAVMNHLVDGTPVGEAADGAVVDEEVGVELAGADAGFVHFLAGVVAVDCEEFESTGFAEVDGFLKELAFTCGPEDEPVAFFLEFSECGCGEGEFLADVGITVFYDGSVKIYCDEHFCLTGV